MVPAARSGVQNIAEGSVDGVASTKLELNLYSVAHGSLEELRLDCEDYLRQHVDKEKTGMKIPEQAPKVKEAAVIPSSGSSTRVRNMADCRNDGLKKRTRGIKLSSVGKFR